MSLTGFVALVLYQVFYTWPRRQSLLIEVMSRGPAQCHVDLQAQFIEK